MRGRERAIVNQTNIGNVSQETLWKLLNGPSRAQRHHLELNWSELNWAVSILTSGYPEFALRKISIYRRIIILQGIPTRKWSSVTPSFAALQIGQSFLVFSLGKVQPIRFLDRAQVPRWCVCFFFVFVFLSKQNFGQETSIQIQLFII